ncbi:MAG: hypothetical protein ACLFTG_08310 [Alphaproteobacteria bacterium]
MPPSAAAARRGSPWAARPALAPQGGTNAPMSAHMIEDMDINAGAVLDEGVSIEEMGRQLFDLVLRVASGEPTKSEASGLGDHAFIPWQIGAVM